MKGMTTSVPGEVWADGTFEKLPFIASFRWEWAYTTASNTLPLVPT